MLDSDFAEFHWGCLLVIEKAHWQGLRRKAGRGRILPVLLAQKTRSALVGVQGRPIQRLAACEMPSLNP